MKRMFCGGWRVSGLIGLMLAGSAQALDMPAVYNGSLDQPRVNMIIRLPGQMDPLDGQGIDLPLPIPIPGLGGPTWNIEGFLDTGASSILIAPAIAAPDEFNIPLEDGWLFEDVGVASTPTPFHITQPLEIRIAPYNFYVDIDNPPNPGVPNDPANYNYFNTVYNHAYYDMRAIVGPISHTTPVSQTPLDELADLLSQVNVFGMPLFKDKVAVFDARGLNSFVLSGDGWLGMEDPDAFPMLQTYLYEPGTPFKEGTINSDPGIPQTQYHIRTNYADFTRFTRVTGDGAEMPSFAHNPFIGANPVNVLEGIPDDTPGITLGRDGQQATGSFLFDTGAAATIISTHLAEQLNIRYKPGQEPGTDNGPRLQRLVGDTWVDLSDFEQFELTIGGIDGTVQIAGFILDSFSVPTVEGEPLNFADVPVLVFDVGTSDPVTGDTIILDGIFGMNMLFATMFIDEPLDLFGLLDAPMTPGAFDWVTFDERTGIIGLSLDPRVIIPEPATGVLLVTAGAMVLMRRRH